MVRVTTRVVVKDMALAFHLEGRESQRENPGPVHLPLLFGARVVILVKSPDVPVLWCQTARV